jgi:hypothetical protein
MYAEAERLRLLERFFPFFLVVGKSLLEKSHVTQTERSKRHGLE